MKKRSLIAHAIVATSMAVAAPAQTPTGEKDANAGKLDHQRDRSVPYKASLAALGAEPDTTNTPSLPSRNISGIEFDLQRDKKLERMWDEKPRVKRALAEAEALMQENQFFSAIERLDKELALMQLDDSRFQLLVRKGHYYLGMRNLADAEDQFQEALLMDPRNVELITTIANLQLNTGRHTTAIELLEQVDIQQVKDPQQAFIVMFNRACAYVPSGQKEKAMEALEKAAAFDAWFTYISLEAPQLDDLRKDPRFIKFRDALKKRAESERGER